MLLADAAATAASLPSWLPQTGVAVALFVALGAIVSGKKVVTRGQYDSMVQAKDEALAAKDQVIGSLQGQLAAKDSALERANDDNRELVEGIANKMVPALTRAAVALERRHIDNQSRRSS